MIKTYNVLPGLANLAIDYVTVIVIVAADALDDILVFIGPRLLSGMPRPYSFSAFVQWYDVDAILGGHSYISMHKSGFFEVGSHACCCTLRRMEMRTPSSLQKYLLLSLMDFSRNVLSC